MREETQLTANFLVAQTVRVARTNHYCDTQSGVLGVASSNLAAPTKILLKNLKIFIPLKVY